MRLNIKVDEENVLYISLSATRGESLRSLWIATGKCAEKERVCGRTAGGGRTRSSVFIKQTKPQTGSNWFEPLFGISHKY